MPTVATFGQQTANAPANVQNAATYNDRGLAREKKGDLNGAIADYNQAIKLDPKHAYAYNNRGNIKSRKGDLNGAMADYNQAIKLDPKYAEAYNNRGNVKFRKGDLNGAMGDYNQAIQLNPQYGLAYRNRGNAKFRSGDFDGAIADFERVIELSSQRVYKEGAASASLPQVGSSSHLVPVRTCEVKSGDVICWAKQHRVNPYLTNADDFELYGKVLDVAKFYTPPQVIIFRPDTTVERVTVEEFFTSGKYFLQVPTAPPEVAARKAHGKAQLEIDAQRQHEIDAKFLREARAETQRWNDALIGLFII